MLSLLDIRLLFRFSFDRSWWKNNTMESLWARSVQNLYWSKTWHQLMLLTSICWYHRPVDVLGHNQVDIFTKNKSGWGQIARLECCCFTWRPAVSVVLPGRGGIFWIGSWTGSWIGLTLRPDPGLARWQLKRWIQWLQWQVRQQRSGHLVLSENIICLLAPTGALVLMMVYCIYIYSPTFSDFEHLCLSILLQVSF